MAGELLQQMAGIKLLHVPYKSNTLAVTDLLGTQIDMMITDAATGLPQVKAGKLRALGVSSAQRSPLALEVPTGHFDISLHKPNLTLSERVRRATDQTEGVASENVYQHPCKVMPGQTVLFGSQ